MLTYDAIITPLDQDFFFSLFESGLQGIGPIVQTGIGAQDPIGTGMLTAQGPVIAPAQVVVRISTTGQLGSAKFDLSFDAGQTFPTLAVTVPANGIYAIASIGATLIFVNGAFNTAQSFLQGESYLFEASLPTFPVTNWEPFGGTRTALEQDAAALASFNNLIAKITNGGFATTAIGAWCDRVGQGTYTERRKPGQPALMQITVKAPAGIGPYTVNPGDLVCAIASTGLLLQSNTLFIVPRGGSVITTLQATQIGAAYNAPTHVGGAAILAIVIGPPGITVDNPPIIGAVSHSGTGTGVVTLTGGVPTGVFNALIKIIQGGAVVAGALGATYSYSLDNGTTYIGPFNCHDTPLLIDGVTATMTGGAGAMVQGDVYAYSSSALLQLGVDRESDGAYMTRCINKWGSLSPNGPDDFYKFQAKQSSLEISNVGVQADQLIAGQVNVTVGGPSGAVSSAALIACLNRLQPRAALCDRINVINETNQNIALVATVYVSKASLAAAQAYVAEQLAALQDLIGAGNLIVFTGTVSNSPLAVLQAMPGLVRIEGYTMGGAALDIQLASGFFPIFTTVGLTFVAV